MCVCGRGGGGGGGGVLGGWNALEGGPENVTGAAGVDAEGFI